MFRNPKHPDRVVLVQPHNLKPNLHRQIFSLSTSSIILTFFFCVPVLFTLTSQFPPLALPVFSLHTSSPFPPHTQMLQRNLKQRRPPRQMPLQRPLSPRMTKAKFNLKKAELRVWRITQKQKSKKVTLCLPNTKAVRFYLFVIFCVAMIFSCWGSFQQVFWLKLILTASGGDDDVDVVDDLKSDYYFDNEEDLIWYYYLM